MMKPLDYLRGLNDQQLKAVTTTDVHTTVLSCPGSGKTKIVETKVVHLLNENPDSFVCCTTFTKEGAGEIQSRVLSALSPDIRKVASSRGNSRLLVATFHSICYHTLARYLGHSPKVARPGEIQFAFRQAAHKIGMTPKSEAFEDYKSLADSIPTMADDSKSNITQEQWDFFSAYKQNLHASGKVDFNDILVKTVQLHKTGELPPTPFTHIVTDESQDNDILMEQWVHLHAKNGSIITMLLDDDQSLYGFRNALGVKACLNLENRFGAYRITNAINYRSHSEILDLAAKLISENKVRVPKDLQAHRGKGGKVEVHHIYDQNCTSQLLENLLKERPGDWFILCRTNADIEQLAPLLFAADIPFKGPDPSSLFEVETVQTYMELLRSLATKSGLGVEIALVMIGFESKQLEEIHAANHIEQLAKADFSTLKIPKTITGKDAEKLADFYSKLDAWKRSIIEGRPARVIRQSSAYIGGYETSKTDCPPIQSAAKVLAKLTGSILQRLNAIKQMIENGKKEKQGNTDGKVVLMTAHASKGLQRPSVLIWNCRQGTYPSLPEDKPNDIEEERRIFYVAMTRAENDLHLVYQQGSRTGSGMTHYNPSRFLIEMGFEFDVPQQIVKPSPSKSSTNFVAGE